MIRDLSHYCFDAGPLALYLIALLLLMACVSMYIGTINMRSSSHLSSRVAQARAQEWVSDLFRFGVAATDTEARWITPNVCETWTRLVSPGMIGTGAGFLLAAVVGTAGSCLLVGNLLLWTAMNSLGSWALVGVFGAGGYTAGLVWGARRVGEQSGPRYAGLSRRRVRDYRSPWLPVGLAVMIGLYVLDGAVCAHFAGSHLSIVVADGSRYLVPNTPWVLLMFPGLMVVVLVGGEMAMGRVVSLPRLFLHGDPERAMVVDDLLRVRALRTLQGVQIETIAWLGGCQMFLVIFGIGDTHLWYVSLAVASGMCVLFPIGFVGSLLTSNNPLVSGLAELVVRVPMRA